MTMSSFKVVAVVAALVTATTRDEERAYKSTGLMFLHIPKTAGATVERTVGRRLAPNRTLTHFKIDVPERGEVSCPYHHVPPRHLASFGEKEAALTWCIVRDPVDRALSVFKEMHPKDLNDSEAANRWISTAVSGFRGAYPVGRQCHLIPMSEYVYGADEATKTCTHVLKFERLEADVDALMIAFGLSWRWTRDFHGARIVSHHAATSLTTASLTDVTKAHVARVYQRDCCNFGYSCCDAAAPPKRPKVSAKSHVDRDSHIAAPAHHHERFVTIPPSVVTAAAVGASFGLALGLAAAGACVACGLSLDMLRPPGAR